MKSVYIHIPFCSNICSYCDFTKLYYNELYIDKYYNVHIKVDLRNKKMAGGNCSCEDYIENKNLHRDFKCKHMMAVAYKFYMLAKKDKKKKLDYCQIYHFL